jgi:hypothetical protein
MIVMFQKKARHLEQSCEDRPVRLTKRRLDTSPSFRVEREGAT